MNKIIYCIDCKFGNPIKKDSVVECHRYAPRILHGSGAGGSDNKFPIMQRDDWCGEGINNDKNST